MRRLSSVGFVLLVAHFAGCSEPVSRETSPNVAVYDSAGVTIVDNGEIDPRVRGFQIDTAPLFRVGWSEHPDSVQFETISDGAILPSGNFAVADRAEVHILRPDGTVAYSVGGLGDGPGEFRAIEGVASGSSDTLVVQDRDRGRVAIFAGADLASDARLPEIDRANRNVVEGIVAGVLVLPPTGFSPAGAPSGGWHTAPVITISEGVVDTTVAVGIAEVGQAHLFSPRGSTRMTSDHIIHARGDQPVLHWYDLEGHLVRVSRWTSPRIEATDSLWNHMRGALREIRPFSEMPEEVYQAAVAEWRAAATGPLPIFSKLRGDAEGGAWLSEFGAASIIPARYFYFDANGVFRGSLELPAGFEVLAFGEGIVLGIERSSLRVAAAVAYEFSPIE